MELAIVAGYDQVVVDPRQLAPELGLGDSPADGRDTVPLTVVVVPPSGIA